MTLEERLKWVARLREYSALLSVLLRSPTPALDIWMECISGMVQVMSEIAGEWEKKKEEGA